MNYNLTKTENNVCIYLKQCLTSKEIADQLFVEEKTVKFHITNIYKKMNVKNRSQAILKLNNIYQDDYNETQENKKEIKVEERFNTPKATTTTLPFKDSSRSLQVTQAEKPAMTQVEKINFIDDKFKVGKVMNHLYSMMEGVTAQEMTANNVNAACNCVARANETITTCIQAAKFLNER